MDTVRVRRVSPPERRRLRRWKRRRTSQVNSCHARVILLSCGGVCNRETGQRVGYTPPWVRVVIHRFNAGGVAGIEWFPYFHGPRGPSKFTADLVEQIAEVALSPPKKLMGMTQWSLAKLREYLIEQKIIGDISLEWLRPIVARRHPKASAISGSSFPGPPSPWSANSRMRARTNFRAAAFPADTIDCNSCRSSFDNVTR